MDKKNTFKGRLLWLLPVFVLMGCSVQMTFKGSSVPENVNTASVQYFENRAPLINPLLSQTFTESLKDRITSESRLVIRDEVGDVDFSGEITGYDLRPMAIQANAISAETRMTITVRVRYRNFKSPQQNWESSFSAYADFESSQNITAIENELVRDIVDQITENIFNRAFSDW
ncbi:MAG: LPS assembly lipoprotein LptE [Bacteroidales bacterium]|nr:LPS assembly lipoprotein LptE [Bacteroidales bacterium]